MLNNVINNMKNYKIFILFIIMGCTNSPIDDLEIGEPFNDLEAIAGNWSLDQVKQVDNLDLNKRSTDLTSLFTSTSAGIEFNGSSFTYSHGSGPNFLENNGNWAFDNEEFPEYVVLNSTTQLKLKDPIRSYDDTLVLIVERKCEGKTISSYEYYFKRN